MPGSEGKDKACQGSHECGFAGAANDPSDLLTDLTISDAVQLQATGSASLNVGPGAVVALVDNLSLCIAKMDVVTGNATLGTLSNADVVSFSIASADVFIGSGATLENNATPANITDDSINTTGALGFSVTGASFGMVSVTDGTNSYSGVTASLTAACLLYTSDAADELRSV